MSGESRESLTFFRGEREVYSALVSIVAGANKAFPGTEVTSGIAVEGLREAVVESSGTIQVRILSFTGAPSPTSTGFRNASSGSVFTLADGYRLDVKNNGGGSTDVYVVYTQRG